VRRVPDLLVPGQWAVECKIVRPFGDNGGLRNTGLKMFSTLMPATPARLVIV
jgi:hypothetical protein